MASVDVEKIPFLGAGLGFRQALKPDTITNLESIDFLELISEQYMDMPPHKEAEARELAARVPLVTHGVELSVGTIGPLSLSYVSRMKQIAEFSSAFWVSDHLCFTRAGGRSVGNLTPIPFTEINCSNIIERVREVRRSFLCPFLLENISYYFTVPRQEMSEAEFITRIMEGADCYMLLDLTNVQNNAINMAYDAFDFVDQLPLDRVMQIHLAGGIFHEGLLLDTHSHPVPDDVMSLLDYALPKMPNLRGVMIERDQNFPPFSELLEELDRIRSSILKYWSPYHAHRPSAVPQWMQAAVPLDYGSPRSGASIP